MMRVHTLFDYFWRRFARKTPIFHLFATDRQKYLYDVGTNKILKCSDFEFDILSAFQKNDHNRYYQILSQDHYRNSYAEIIRSIENENILQTFPPLEFGLSGHFHNLEDIINKSMRMIQLEVTETCNLRCRYCIYNDCNDQRRNHGDMDMPIETALKTIDYLSNHCESRDEVSITFYGGEPLLRYDFIKDCVEYSQKMMPRKKLFYSLTTNGVLMTSEKAKYFYEHNFGLAFSIDGPMQTHDKYRLQLGGQGSFRQAIDGLKYAIDEYGEEASKRILLSMVYTPPFKEKHINEVASLWDMYSFIPKTLAAMITYPTPGTIPIEYVSQDDLIEDVSLRDWAYKKYDSFIYQKEELHPIARNVIESKLARIFQRGLFESPLNQFHLNGCCIPANRRLFVTVRGDFKLCERLSDGAPNIGNIHQGINMININSYYVKEYSEISSRKCSSCWAIQMCQICYVHSIRGGIIDGELKSSYCENERHNIECHLKKMCEYLEYDPASLKYLYDIKLE